MPRNMFGFELSLRSMNRNFCVACRRACSRNSTMTESTLRVRNVRPLVETTSLQNVHLFHWQPRPVITGTMRNG